MIKYTLILSLVFFGTSFDSTNATELPSIEFSKPAAEFESGQPVFPKGTKAILRNLPAEKARVMINDQVDRVLDAQNVDISKLVKLSEGTYTIVVETSNGQSEIFGFTIK
ncbi:hypothetical protein [Ekhidna sp. To15]|uniref:hypothetical protein n=1 Tax=Ekhidna sp. To15 TaxID=3395267 RepID=UPI003F524E78